MSDGGAFGDVEKSVSGRRWRLRPTDNAHVLELQRREGLPEIAARLLAGRGVTPEAAEDFLRPTLRRLFPDPSSFTDMDLAVEVIEDAIESNRPCAVLADYDVDGGTSAALLVRYFRARGRELQIYVPDRMAEGYGPSALAFERLYAQGVRLVITVDCGAAAHAPLDHAHALGLDVVVLDHHLMSGPPPKARAVVNPNRPDCMSGQGALTAAGVTLVTIVGVNRAARKRGAKDANHLPDPSEWLDLAALGTVCDVAPLTGFNRAMVVRGLQKLAKGGNVGLRELGRAAGKAQCQSVYDLGFVLGPRLNAGGRIGDSGLAARLLSTENPEEAAELASMLDSLNSERRAIEQNIVLQATRQAEESADAVLVAAHNEWHPGVIGVAAGRLKERLMRPVIIIGGGGPGEAAKGSGRSVPGVNLGRAVAQAASEGLLRAGGGHAMAAGLSLDWEQLDAFRLRINDVLRPECAAAASEARTLWVDAMVSARAADFRLLEAIARIGPYGPGHAEPIFGMSDVRICFAQRLKGDHVRATMEDGSGTRIPAIAFRIANEPLGEALLQRPDRVQVLARLSINSHAGIDQVQAEILDLAW